MGRQRQKEAIEIFNGVSVVQIPAHLRKEPDAIVIEPAYHQPIREVKVCCIPAAKNSGGARMLERSSKERRLYTRRTPNCTHVVDLTSQPFSSQQCLAEFISR